MLNSISNPKNLPFYCFVLAVFVISAGTALAQNSLPVADAGEDVNMFLGETILLHGTATDSSGDPVLNPTWSWTIDVKPAGSMPFLSDPTGQHPYFTPDMAGDYVVSLVVSDGTNESLPDSITVRAVLNLPPVAIATADVTTGTAPLTVNFDGSQSFDPEGGFIITQWAFSDGSFSSEVAPTHVFQWAGTYLVSLMVWDDWSQAAQDTLLITVCGDGINCPPVADAGEDVNMFLGETIVLHGTATDSSGEPVLNPTWSWTVDIKPAGSMPFLSDLTGQNPYFVPDMAGDYVLSLVVSDGTNESLPDSITVHAALNLPPVAIATADVTTGSAPLTVNFDGSQSFDPEGGPIVVVWSFSDGSYSSEIAPTHIFQWAGTYLVSLKVRDDWSQAAQDTLLITVTPGGNIAVSPAEYDFGDVELGSLSSTIITITNPLGGMYEDPVYIENISLAGGGSGSFAVTLNPVGSTIQPGESNDVGITFTPLAEGYVSTILQIESDDPVYPLIEVVLGGVGVLDELPPEGQIAAILGFFDAAVEVGSLVGDGPGNSAGNRLNAQRNMIEASGDLIEDELYEEACGQLAAALKKCDGQPNPPDFVTGPAATVLRSMIEVLRTTLECE